MSVSVPLAGVLAALGIYGVVIAIIALKRGDTKGSNFETRVEWVAVLAVSLFGFIGMAVSLAFSGGQALPYLASTAIVGVLGVGFFKMLEITPTALFAVIIDTRNWGKRRRRARSGLRHLWESSKIDGNVVKYEEELQAKWDFRNARGGAVALATLVASANVNWGVKVGDALGLGLLTLVPLAVLWVALIGVFMKAGYEVADRAPGVDWRRPF